MKTLLADKIRPVLAVIVLCLTLAGFQAVSTAAGGLHGRLTAEDYKFLANASHWSVMDLALGHIALQKSTNSAVCAYAQRMVDDYQKAGSDATLLATREGVDLPEIGTLEDRNQLNLAKLGGADLDQAYMNLMVTDHNNEVALFETEVEDAANPDLEAWASKMLALSQANLKMAEDTYAAITGNTAAN